MKKFINKIGLAIAFILVSLSGNAQEDLVLWSNKSELYITSINGYLSALTSDPNKALRIRKIDLGNGRFALKDLATNTYIRAGVGNGARLAVGSKHIKGWETFEIRSEGRFYSIKSVQNGKYVRAGVGGNSFLSAISPVVNAWEGFNFWIAPDLADSQQREVFDNISGSYKVTHIAVENGFLVRLGEELAANTSVVIDGNGRINASAGCNNISATVLQIDNWLTTPDNQVLITRMGCASRAVHNIEIGIFRAIRDMQEFSKQGSSYTLSANGKDLMIIRRD